MKCLLFVPQECIWKNCSASNQHLLTLRNHHGIRQSPNLKGNCVFVCRRLCFCTVFFWYGLLFWRSASGSLSLSIKVIWSTTAEKKSAPAVTRRKDLAECSSANVFPAGKRESRDPATLFHVSKLAQRCRNRSGATKRLGARPRKAQLLCGISSPSSLCIENPVPFNRNGFQFLHV